MEQIENKEQNDNDGLKCNQINNYIKYKWLNTIIKNQRSLD